jgi:hypothetical protein
MPNSSASISRKNLSHKSSEIHFLTTKKGFKSLTRKPQGTTAAMGAKVDTISLSLSLSLLAFKGC